MKVSEKISQAVSKVFTVRASGPVSHYRAKTSADFARLPRHVAIIMDGNGRWAQKHQLSVSKGHRRGTETLREIIRHTDDLGIEVLSVYAFSTENWSRSQEEVAALMQLILDFFASEIDELEQKNVRIRILGDKDGMPEKQRDALLMAEQRTAGNTGLNLCIAINYGGRNEIMQATRRICRDAMEGKIDPERMTETDYARYLYTDGLPDVDLLIRTSGEMRLSNFLLWQVSYAEFTFPTTLWPDFDLRCYDEAISVYADRDRRFGGRKR